MTTKIKPVGSRLLVSPIELQLHKTESGIEVQQTDLSAGIVVEVSDDLKELFNVDDTILYGKDAGSSQPYNGKICTWLNSFDVWGVIQPNN